MTRDNLSALFRDAAQMGANLALEGAGLTAGLISQRKARDLYGKWFMDAAAHGRIQPARIENGRGGARKYRIADILALRASDQAAAYIKTNIIQ